MIPSQKQRINPELSIEKMSTVARFFRFLIWTNIFPLRADLQQNQLHFSFCSIQSLAFIFYCTFSSIGVNVAYGIFGYSRIWSFLAKFADEARPTDFISLMQSWGIGFIIISSFGLFMKNTVTISSEITLSKTLQWPTHGFRLIFVSILYFLAFGFLNINQQFVMAAALEIQTSDALFIIYVFSTCMNAGKSTRNKNCV